MIKKNFFVTFIYKTKLHYFFYTIFLKNKIIEDTKYSNSNSNINGIFKDIAYIEDTSVPNSPVVNTPKRKRSVEEAEDKSSFYTKEWTDEEIVTFF